MTYFGGTNWTIQLDSCPPAGPAWVNPGTIQAFGGLVCNNVHVLGWYINGTAFHWAPKDVIGGIMGSIERQGTWGFEGVRNEKCAPKEKETGGRISVRATAAERLLCLR
jgi:hypothetical protein